MARGIINPYYKPPPKKERPPIYDREFTDTEDEIGIRPVQTRLDGDRFVIEFTGIQYEDIQQELISLFTDIYKAHPEGLQKYGIKIVESVTNVPTGKDEMTLKNDQAALTVFVGNSPSEQTIFNRLGFALTQLPVQSILVKHNVKVIMRG